MQHEIFTGRTDIPNLGEGESFYMANFIDPKNTTQGFDRLTDEVPWRAVKARGNEMRRLKAAFVDFNADGSYPYYRYPFMFSDVEPFHPLVGAYRDALQETVPDFTLNHAIATYYKDGHVTIGDHQDNPRDIAPGSLIFDVSLGASRWFCLTSNDNTRRQEILLQPGSLLVLDWATNEAWKHSVPIDSTVHDPRISIVFRSIRTMYDPVRDVVYND